MYPKARQLIKYLVAAGRYDYIETGSLISLKHKIKRQILNLYRNDVTKLARGYLFDRISLNEGMFMENVVAEMLRCNGYKLFFYSRSDKESGNLFIPRT